MSKKIVFLLSCPVLFSISPNKLYNLLHCTVFTYKNALADTLNYLFRIVSMKKVFPCNNSILSLGLTPSPIPSAYYKLSDTTLKSFNSIFFKNKFRMSYFVLSIYSAVKSFVYHTILIRIDLLTLLYLTIKYFHTPLDFILS